MLLDNILLVAILTLLCFTCKCVFAIRRCGQSICSDYQVCCAHGNDTAVVTCCRELVDSTYYNIAMVTRKLSGVLIMLLLFAFGYFVQRMLCSRSRQLSAPNSGPPTAATSQEMLIENYTPDSLRSPAMSAPLPSYEDLKRLPTYEETIRESCIQQGTLT
ncbi:unnamed protein product [Knipowitschia caucasica]